MKRLGQNVWKAVSQQPLDGFNIAFVSLQINRFFDEYILDSRRCHTITILAFLGEADDAGKENVVSTANDSNNGDGPINVDAAPLQAHEAPGDVKMITPCYSLNIIIAHLGNRSVNNR